jgi:hypothetical protein
LAYLILRYEYTLQVQGSKNLRKLLTPRNNEDSGQFRIGLFRNENLATTGHLVLLGNVTMCWMGETTACRIMARKRLGRPGRRWEDNKKMILKEMCVRAKGSG